MAVYAYGLSAAELARVEGGSITFVYGTMSAHDFTITKTTDWAAAGAAGPRKENRTWRR
jgi:hypothetical protein